MGEQPARERGLLVFRRWPPPSVGRWPEPPRRAARDGRSELGAACGPREPRRSPPRRTGSPAGRTRGLA